MRSIFKQAARHQSPHDIVMSTVPPFGHFDAAGFLHDFYTALSTHQAASQRDILGGFAFGGAFSDLGVGRRPKDYDLYISSPQMIDSLKQAFTDGVDDDLLFTGEWADEAWGYNFPIVPTTEDLPLYHSDVFGEYVGFSGMFRTAEGARAMDVIVGTENPTLENFLAYTPAPVMAAGMTLGSSFSYFAYHRDFVDHAQRGILCTDRVPARNLIEKARRKGWEVISPEALARRAADPLPAPV